MPGMGWREASPRTISGIPQESVLGPESFNVFINYLNEATGHTLSEFDDTKLGGAPGWPKGYAAIQ